ncbi:MAG: hypothetical protein ACYDGN_05280 [Acidimicrobiales bacterium]
MQHPPYGHLLDQDGHTDSDGRAFAAVLGRHQRRKQARMWTLALACLVLVCTSAVGLGLSWSSTGRSPRLSANSASSGSALRQRQSAAPGLRFIYSRIAELVPSAVYSTTGGAIPANSETPPYASSAICTFFGCGRRVLSQTKVIERSVDGVLIQAFLVYFGNRFRLGGAQPQTSHGAPATGSTQRSGRLPASTKSGMALPLCIGRGELVISVTVGHLLLGEVRIPVTSGAREPMRALAEGLLNPVRGHPVLIAAAHVGPSVRSVSARFANGSTDRSVPSHGWVVLVGRPANANQAVHDGVQVVALSGTGLVVERAAIPGPGEIGIAAAACHLIAP